MRLRRDLAVPLLLLCACARPAPTGLAPAATVAAISAQDLRQRLFTFAADSMLGRETGTIGNVKGTDYIAAEFRRLGLEPAGDNGTYFQTVPLVNRAVDDASTIGAGSSTLAAWKDFAPFVIDSTRSLAGVRAVYGGSLTDSTTWIAPQEMAGRIVVLGVPPDQRQYLAFGILTQLPRFAGAVAVAAGELHLFPQGMMGQMKAGDVVVRGPGSKGPFQLVLSPAATTALLGAPIGTLSRGALGPALSGSVVVRVDPLPAPVRNVVAILPGSDPRLKGEYVALGAHNDHLGLAPHPVDHDSLRAFNRVIRPRGADSPERRATAAEQATIRAGLDSLRRLHPPRPDSVYNGADDDGSGTVALVEIAEAAARTPQRPRRSLLFVSHTGEEEGVFGSSYFVEHPTVPRDSIVAQLNMDMIGRGDAADLPGGGPSYLQVIGSRRLSTELGDLAEQVNAEGKHGFRFDYSLDAPGDPEQVYCRSDHTEYARFGIPIIFVTTDLHEDYHQVTDEPEYIDYVKLARVAGLVDDLALRVANLDHRVVVDHPKPDPNAPCRQ